MAHSSCTDAHFSFTVNGDTIIITLQPNDFTINETIEGLKGYWDARPWSRFINPSTLPRKIVIEGHRLMPPEQTMPDMSDPLIFGKSAINRSATRAWNMPGTEEDEYGYNSGGGANDTP